MKQIRISDFRYRIMLYDVHNEIDAEMNRIERLIPLQEVYACVEVKNSSYAGTTTGERPETVFKIHIRKNKKDFKYIKWDGNILRVLAPVYDVDGKYTYFEAVMDYEAKEDFFTKCIKEC